MLDGLARKLYADQEWQIGDAKLRLINTKTYGWEPNVWEDNTLTIKNSDFSGSSVNGGGGIYIIDNVTADGPMRTNEKVQMTIKNSIIKGDVIAADDSKITLVNTTVKGRIIQEGNGMVYGASK